MNASVMFAFVLWLSAASAVAHQAIGTFQGRPLADALQALQSAGLRIVFSSELVTPSMRVAAEPRAKSPQKILDEILEPHGLRARAGPGGVIQIVRAKRFAGVAPQKQPTATPTGTLTEHVGDAATGLPSYNEHVTVTAPTQAGSSETTLSRTELADLRSILADDPVRTVHALPGVTATDDFRSEFSVRGSAPRHIGIVIEDVPTRWLQHAIDGRGATPSLTMFGSDALEQATLSSGAYVRRYSDSLGAELRLTFREGSRTASHVRGTVGPTNAAVLAEGPIGKSKAGSWLVTLRHSYVEWPIGKLGGERPTGAAFDFTDTLAKLVYDVRPNHQVSVSVFGGRSRIDRPDDPGLYELADGRNGAAVMNVAWRSTFASGLVLNQRAYLVAHQFLNRNRTGDDWRRGTDREVAYRVEITRAMTSGVLSAGGDVQRMTGSRSLSAFGAFTANDRPATKFLDAFQGSLWQRSAYLNFGWSAVPRITLTPGLRITHSTLIHSAAVSPWILSEWSLGSGWTLNVASGVSHQYPNFDHVLSRVGARDLEPERAAHIDVGVEHRLPQRVRWSATFFKRAEREILREPGLDPPDRLHTEAVGPPRYENALSGSSRGVELLVERRSPVGLSGWVAYTYGKARYRDPVRNEAFWADYDQRHALNATATYRLSRRMATTITYRSGTNLPIPTYLARRDSELVASTHRKDLRLPHYSRLDLRAHRILLAGQRRLTFFVEVLNVLNRRNLASTDATWLQTGDQTGLTRELFSRLPSAGLVVEF